MSLQTVENGTVRRDDVALKSPVKTVLVVDVGGTSVKILATGRSERRSPMFSRCAAIDFHFVSWTSSPLIP